MYYIKLDENKTLITTVYEPIYRGENLATRMIFLIPANVGDADILKSQIYLCSVRADGEADITELNRGSEMYKEKYYQYMLPVNCNITKYPGEFTIWLNIFSGSKANPIIIKSSELVISVLESQSLDTKIGDRFVTALWQTKKVADSKADGLQYDKDNRKLNLKSGDTKIGNIVTIPADDYDDGDEDTEWGEMGEDDLHNLNYVESFWSNM